MTPVPLPPTPPAGPAARRLHHSPRSPVTSVGLWYAGPMPRFEPFAGLRYAASVDLDRVIAPPYDVVLPPERAVLAGRDPANAIRVELPEPDEQAGLDRYRAAAHLLARWEHEGVVARDPAPALYVYRMTPPGGKATTGVIGCVGIDDASAESVLPHEQTLPKPKTDRLDLLRATGANLSPIWGLSLADGLTATFSATTDDPPAGAATDDDGVFHQLWVVDRPDVIDRVRRAVEAAPLVVADGHHRYETARTFLHEGGAALPDRGPGTGATLLMALVVELSEDQLSVGPVHRALSGLSGDVDLPAAFGTWFDVVPDGPATDDAIAGLGRSQALALVTAGGVWRLTPKPGAVDEAGADLDSALVGLVLDHLPDHDLDVCHTWPEALEALRSGRAEALVLLRPATVGQIAEWAHARRRMPPKTTYFFPKPRTGMVFRTLGA